MQLLAIFSGMDIAEHDFSRTVISDKKQVLITAHLQMPPWLIAYRTKIHTAPSGIFPGRADMIDLAICIADSRCAKNHLVSLRPEDDITLLVFCA